MMCEEESDFIQWKRHARPSRRSFLFLADTDRVSVAARPCGQQQIPASALLAFPSDNEHVLRGEMACGSLVPMDGCFSSLSQRDAGVSEEYMSNGLPRSRFTDYLAAREIHSRHCHE